MVCLERQHTHEKSDRDGVLPRCETCRGNAEGAARASKVPQVHRLCRRPRNSSEGLISPGLRAAMVFPISTAWKTTASSSEPASAAALPLSITSCSSCWMCSFTANTGRTLLLASTSPVFGDMKRLLPCHHCRIASLEYICPSSASTGSSSSADLMKQRRSGDVS